MPRFIVCLILLVACTGCHTGIRSWLLGHKPAYLGKPDPYYALSTVDGQRQSLAAFRGKIVVVTLWATWCPPCREEIPALERFAPQAAAKNVALVAVDTGEPRAPVASFVKNAGVNYPVLLDSEQRYWHYYDVTAIPETIVLNKAGIPVKTFLGEFDPAAIERIVTSIAQRG